MTCPPEISHIICKILKWGILHTRNAAWHDDSKLAAQFADHVHNLSDLLNDFSHDKLKYYWEVERPVFSDSVGDELRPVYLELWQELEPHLDGTVAT